VVRKMRSPQTQGEEGDHGTSTCHKAFVGVIFVGGFALSETPEQFGPRNWGQFAEAVLSAHKISSNVETAKYLDVKFFTPAIEKENVNPSNTRIGLKARSSARFWTAALLN
jgi:hypothetical protein